MSEGARTAEPLGCRGAHGFEPLPGRSNWLTRIIRGDHMQNELRVGEPDVDPSMPSHVPGVAEGNARGNYEKMPGHLPDGRSTAKRSTGINPDDHDPILPIMPNLSPP